MINAEQLNAIKERAAKATPGPWIIEESRYGSYNAKSIDDNYDLPACLMRMNDAEFVTKSREDVPTLVAEVEQLQAELNRVDALYSEKYVLTTHYKNLAYEQSLEIERLRKALEYYADRKHYGIWTDASNNCPTADVLFDGGFRAMEALTNGEESNAL